MKAKDLIETLNWKDYRTKTNIIDYEYEKTIRNPEG